MTKIILTTLNARYIHASLGLRYLMANMQDLQTATELVEFEINTRPIDIAEDLIHRRPEIIGFGVYIWNVLETTQLVQLLKQVSPQTLLVVGGPEVSFETCEQAIYPYADYVVTGPADLAFADLCRQLVNGEKPPQKLINAKPVDPKRLCLPYRFYKDEDIAHRVLYVEASRGCPFKCEFCLSSLDKTSLPFDLDQFLDEMEALYQRGARRFKFVDRTFNLKAATGVRILRFFLHRMTPGLFLHFEMIPDHLPTELRKLIQQFPPATLQFEIGIQSFNSNVQQLISRKQNRQKTTDNLSWLRAASNAHLHVDLIAGLPGEDIESFALGFNALVALRPHEIQVGILKRLRGTPILRYTDSHQLKFNPQPPYNILATDNIDFETMQRLCRFSRYWDLIGNSGHFIASTPLLLGEDPFGRFLALSDWLFGQTKQTHTIALKRLYERVYLYLTSVLGVSADRAVQVVYKDYSNSGIKGYPKFLNTDYPGGAIIDKVQRNTPPARQKRHLQNLNSN